VLIAHTTTLKDDFAWTAAYEKSKTARAKLAEKHPDLAAKVEAAFAAAKPSAALETSASPLSETEEVISYPLFNQFGEEDDGPAGPAHLPVQFARDFERVYVAAKPDGRALLGEFNQESLSAASAASKDAEKILNEVFARFRAQGPIDADNSDPREPPKSASLEERFDVARTKTPKGGWDVVAWVNTARAVIAGITSGAELDEFKAVNAESIGKLPATAKTVFENALSARREALVPTNESEDDGPSFFEEEAQEVLPPAPKTEWESAYDTFCADINNARTTSDLHAISSNAAMKVRLRQIKDNRPDLAEKLSKLYSAKDAEIKASK